MNYNYLFTDTMDNINNIGKSYGYKNGIDWAGDACRKNQLDYGTYKQYENCHNLRIRMAHGNAKDIRVSQETYSTVKRYESYISHSHLRRRYEPKNLSNGGFRGKPYIKEFVRYGNDGETYKFKFEIQYEYNYLDNGVGGTYGTGYFIHIIRAPYFSYASERLHEFHMIQTSNDYHVCWNKIITDFEAANAVMYVWVNRYADLIDVLKKETSISEKALMKKANRRSVLPTGTFRGGYDKGVKPISQQVRNNNKQNNKNKNDKPNKNKNAAAVHNLPTGTFRNKQKRGNTMKKGKNIKRRMREMFITESIFKEIVAKLGTKKPEMGGMLGSTMDPTIIDTYVFDAGARVNSVEYNPNVDYLNEVINNEWEEEGVFLTGFVHSHPGDYGRLSYADVEYAIRIMKAFELEYLFMPIVTSSYEYITSLTGYIVNCDGSVERCKVSVIEEDEAGEEVEISEEMLQYAKDGFLEMDTIESSNDNGNEIKKVELPKTEELEETTREQDSMSQDYTFARVSKVIDIEYMSECSVIGIGCGGSRGFYEDMARMGVSKFYLMDGDIASYSNIASQNGYISEVGMHKPALIKKRILDINDKAEVICFNCMLDDSLDDEYLEKEIINKVDSKKALICAFTDNFFAQARISRIALKYGIPFISGEHHEAGNTSEVIFWYPGITKYSRREIAKGRYEAYEKGFKNDVTSVGSPIFNTTRLNGLCEKIGLGMLMYGKEQSHMYCSFLNTMADRNLILVKQKYLEEDNVLRDWFYNDEQSCFDEVVWIHPESIEDLYNTVREEDTNLDDTRRIYSESEE